ncbi:MAG: efflux RND transporter periplasmic adaptor subunit [Planctomycetaceae bacterium]
MANSTTDERTAPMGGKVAPTPRPLSARPFWSGLWGKLWAHIWQIGVGLLVAAVVTTLLFWRMFAPVDVRSHEVTSGEIVAEVMGTGTVATHVKVTISANITGLLSEVFFDQGDQVKAGQVVARLDDRDLTRQVKVEEANVSARKATVDRLIADRTSAKSLLELTTKSYERAKTLLGKNAISQEDYDIRFDAFTTANAGMERAEAALVEGQKLQIAAEETLEFHKARLAYTVITAPFDGLIVRRDRDPGDVVVPGTSVLYLVSLKEVWVNAWVDETKQAMVKPGQAARVVFRSEPGVNYRGAVARIGRETDPETREFLVDVQPEKLPEQWSVGQRAEVYIETARTSTTTFVPSQFLVKREGKTGVFVAVQGHAEWRVLTLGLQGRETVEVIDGAVPGEIVVTPADPKAGPLTDGRRVTLP